MEEIFPLTEREHEIMSYLYQFRILSLTQIYEKWFRFKTEDETKISSCRLVLHRFQKRKGYIQVVYHPLTKERCYTLTQKGLTALRAYGIRFIGTKQHAFTAGDFVRLSQLKLNDRLYSHQLCLNQFVLDFASENCPVSWEYYDEKFVGSVLKGIRPDGILKIEDTYYFIEMDMDTEREKALNTKWQHYRTFLKSEIFRELDGPVKVLFLINSYSPTRREDFLRKSMFDGLYDKFNYRFDAYFGSIDEMRKLVLDDIFENYLDTNPITETLQSFGFQIKQRNELPDALYNLAFEMYVQRKGNGGNEFFVCDFRNSSTAALHDIFDWSGTQFLIKKLAHRNIPYLIICDALEKNIEDIVSSGITFEATNIYYTTIDRLRQMTFANAVVHIDMFGNVYHFNTESLSDFTLEFTLPIRKKI